MRRLLVSVFVASGLVLIGAGTASAEQAPAAGAAQAAGKKICKITDERLGELSGLVATGDGFVVINDSSDQASRNRIFFLDDKCEVGRTVSYSGDGPRDTEDMALSPDGKTLWIADIGDNRKDRRTVGLWSMPADGEKKPKIHRLAYPAAKHDAEALLINGDGTPIIVTKEFGRAASIYTPAAPLKTDNTEGVALRKVGEVTVPASDTSANTLARIGRATIDGGAVSRDGSKVVLRTYTDALEFDVKNGDVVAALKGKPRVTPLPDEPFGEAISYSPDGKYLYTVSDMGESQDGENFILRYTPAAAVATTKADATGGTGGGDSGLSWFDKLTINDITYIVGGVGVLGAILVGAGIFGIMRSRKRPPPAPGAKGDGPDGPKPADAETELLTVGGAAAGRGSGVYGGNRPAAGPAYGGPGAGPGKGAGVYGGQPGGRPGGAPAGGRPGAGQPGGGGRPGGGGHPAARPGAGGQPAGRPGGAPVGQPGRPGGQPGRPAGGQPARPGGAAQPARPGGAAQPARPGGAGQPGRPGGAAEPARGGGGQPPGRPGGVQPGRPGGAQPGRAGGGRPVPPAGGQPPAGRPGAQPGGGVYGGGSPQPPARDSSAGGPGQRPSGFFGQGAGHPEPGRPAPSGMNYADTQGRSRNFDNPGYGRHPYGR